MAFSVHQRTRNQSAKGWVCQLCTLENAPTAQICAVCCFTGGSDRSIFEEKQPEPQPKPPTKAPSTSQYNKAPSPQRKTTSPQNSKPHSPPYTPPFTTPFKNSNKRSSNDLTPDSKTVHTTKRAAKPACPRLRAGCPSCNFSWPLEIAALECPRCLHQLTAPTTSKSPRVRVIQEITPSEKKKKCRRHVFRFGKCSQCGTCEGKLAPKSDHHIDAWRNAVQRDLAPMLNGFHAQ